MIQRELLLQMRHRLSEADADEMAIPSYLHRLAPLRWMALKRIRVVEDGIRRLSADGTGTALDFGCGTGILFETLSRHYARVVGVDLVLDAAELLLQTQPMPAVELLHPDRIDEAIPDASLELIVAAEVLEHVDDLDGTIRLLMRKLSPQGRMIITLPTENALYRLGRRIAGFSGHYHHENARSIHRRLNDMGAKRTVHKAIPLPGPLCVYMYGEYTFDNAQ